jgi:hypothetical protein
VIRALRYVWAAPTVLLVLPLGLLLWALRQARPLGWSWGVWEWEACEGSMLQNALYLGPAAVTLGWAVLWRRREYSETPQIALHERRHAAQALALGPLYLPAYLLFSILWGYQNNPMEVDARAHSSGPRSWPPDASTWSGL